MRLEHAMLSTAFRYFQATAEAGSIRAAARAMNVASSAVNRQILMLEDALGLKLFERTGRKLVITEPGTVLLQTVESSLVGYEQALRVIEAMKGLETGQVHVASVESVAVALLRTKTLCNLSDSTAHLWLAKTLSTRLCGQLLLS